MCRPARWGARGPAVAPVLPRAPVPRPAIFTELILRWQGQHKTAVGRLNGPPVVRPLAAAQLARDRSRGGSSREQDGGATGDLAAIPVPLAAQRRCRRREKKRRRYAPRARTSHLRRSDRRAWRMRTDMLARADVAGRPLGRRREDGAAGMRARAQMRARVVLCASTPHCFW